uniref:Uncharacterized protein zf(Matrin)-3 n=1 Tax=Phallusia mammillata TaxID=59560 RepID=A0A6F9DKD9_9ASCI|nr:uncharacterized protein zf(matrin)-3 [Phallusia mammillata]
MTTKKTNTLAALRMMVESDDDDEEETSTQNGLSNEEILRIQFESTQPQQPLKGILKRKMPKQDGTEKEDSDCSKKTENGSSPEKLKPMETTPIKLTNNQQDPPSPKKGLAAQGLAQALMFIKDNEEDVTKDEKEVEKIKSMETELKQKQEVPIIKTEPEATVQSESVILLATEFDTDTKSEEKSEEKSQEKLQDTDTTPPVIAVKEEPQTNNNDKTTVSKEQKHKENQNSDHSTKKLEADENVNKDVKPPLKKFIMKLNGLPLQFSKRELMIFLGVWPMNGNDGIRCITDRYGEPTGRAYLELDRHQDKMDVLRMSGMTFNDKLLKAVISSASEMNRDWALTEQATKQLEKSTFVRLSKLKTTASKEDITKALARFHLKTEDIYCHSSSDDCENDGTVFVVTDSFKVANALCFAQLLSNGRPLEARKVHPDFVSQWCSKNDIPFSVREFGDVDVTELESPEQLEPDINEPDPNTKLTEAELKTTSTPEEDVTTEKTIKAEISESEKPTISAKPVIVTSQPPKLTPTERKPPRPIAPFPLGQPPMGPMPMRPPFMPGPPMMMGMMRPPGMMPMGPHGRPMGPPGARPMGPPGMGPRPGFIPTIYMRMYNLPEQANTDDIKQFFAPIVPAKIAQNTGYNIFDVDFYTPADTMMALKRQGMLIRKNPISMEMLPGPPIPLPPRMNLNVNRKRTRPESPPRAPRYPVPPKRRDYSPPRQSRSPPRREQVPRRERSPPRRERSPPRRERSPKRRGRTPPRRGYSPLRRGRSPPRHEFSPPRRGYSPERRGRTPPRRSPDFQQKRPHESRWKPVRPRTPPSTRQRESSPVLVKSIETIKVDPFPENPFDYRLAQFNPDKPAGQCAIQVMEGYFCQLCRKFYNSKTAGKITHCKTKGHYDKLKEHLEKLKRKKMNQK